MKKYILFILLPALLSSCASIFNGRYAHVRVHARPGEVVTYTNDRNRVDTAFVLADGSSIFPALRGQRTVEVRVISDTASQDITLLPIYSWLYYANIYPFYCMGMLIDYTSPKRFGYPANIYPDKTKKRGFTTARPLRQYEISLTVQPPVLMGYFINPATYNFAGNVLGAGLGVNYCYSRHNFFSGEVSGAAAWRDRYNYNITNANGGYRVQDFAWVSLSARHHHALGRLDLGYGLSGSWQHCKESDVYNYGGNENEVLFRKDNFITLGIATAANFRLTNSIHVGVNYQPQMLSITRDGAALAYSHLFSTGFFFRIPVSKPR